MREEVQVKAFWWFKENSLAGMARPGFNGVHWYEVPFEESLVYSWIGQRTCDTQPLDSLKNHIADYGAKIAGFFKVDEPTFQTVQKSFEDPAKVLEVVGRLKTRTDCLEHFELGEDGISFRLSKARLALEIEFLKKQKIETIVTLTENHNQKEELESHFDLHHFAIDDLNAPRYEQVTQLASLIRDAEVRKKRIAVHCMAGIGRTSTMLIAAHVVLGEDLQNLKSHIAIKNPAFQIVGPQGEFLHSIAERSGCSIR